jgi:hypothetical protein
LGAQSPNETRGPVGILMPRSKLCFLNRVYRLLGKSGKAAISHKVVKESQASAKSGQGVDRR